MLVILLTPKPALACPPSAPVLLPLTHPMEQWEKQWMGNGPCGHHGIAFGQASRSDIMLLVTLLISMVFPLEIVGNF